MRSALLGALLAATPAFAALTYTCDPNIDATVPGTCTYLNNTIAGLYNSTFANVNASIYIQYGNTGLGQSFYILNQVSYSDYLTALTASAQASGNTVQVAAVNALTNFDTAAYGNGTVQIPSALGAALGFSPVFGTTADGMNPCYPPGTATCFDGIVTITTTESLYYRIGSEGSQQYDFYSTAEHETDEVLGTGSCIDTTNTTGLFDGCGGNTPSAVDLYRYQSAGHLVLIGTTPGAYFSYDGGQTNGAGTKMKVYNTLDDGEDYADFVSSFPCDLAQSVQDAEGCPGQDAGLDITNDGGAEINILNAVGYSLNPQSVTPPVISNVLNGATAQSTIAAGTYVAIYGSNLSTTNPGRQWAGPDFTTHANGTLSLPTSLDGTSVTVSGMPAYVEYISPTQLNIITPATGAAGNGVPVVVTLNGQASATFSITLHNLAPSFFAFPGTEYLAAQHAANLRMDVGPAGLYPGLTTPAVPGETIVLYGTGFGPTSPPIMPGIVTDQIYNLSPTPTATLGGIPATVGFAGLIPGFAEVYQFNVTIPANAPNGDLPLIVTVNGTQSFSGLITVHAP